ncbi:MAG: hypothetical protein EOM67_01535 [Spirochaetia bacterium]|nr:hypothetical protein [Spirochaetia bacterium]
METADILSMGEWGLSLFSRNKARKQYKSQESAFKEQAALNMHIGAFNAAVAEHAGEEESTAIFNETKRIYGEQRVKFAQMGIEMSGSPMFVMGETLSMGMKKYQESKFNTNVNMMNTRYAAIAATSTAKANAESARWGARGENVNIFKDVLQGVKMLSSMASSGGGLDVFGLFKGLF